MDMCECLLWEVEKGGECKATQTVEMKTDAAQMILFFFFVVAFAPPCNALWRRSCVGNIKNACVDFFFLFWRVICDLC